MELVLVLILLVAVASGQDGPVCPRIRVPTSLDQKDDEILHKRRAELCVISCEDDNDCNNQEKCCSTSCGGKLCVGPVPELVKSGTCPPMGEKMFACKKIGDSCTSDASCPFNYKCCPGYCGHVCVEPIKEAEAQAPVVNSQGQDYPSSSQDYYDYADLGSEKLGSCPPETLADRLGRLGCKMECRNDGQCFGDLKCCKKGCSQRCLKPVGPVGRPVNDIGSRTVSRRRLQSTTNNNNRPAARNQQAAKSSKAGCPPSPGALFSNLYCSNECLDDFMCAIDELCCPVGRCFVCTPRVPTRA